MIFKKITLKNYRNYKEKTFEFSEKVNILVGKNGKGKTNLLESIYLTSYGKSFRTNKDKELIRFGQEFCEVKGEYDRSFPYEEENNIEIKINKSGKRKGVVNGIEFKKYSDIFDNVLAVIFSPEDLKIVKESPEKRRSFIDNELSKMSIAYYRDVLTFGRILQQRNSYLKKENRELELLKIWDDKFIEYGSRIAIKRFAFIKKLEKICIDIHGRITDKSENIKLLYESGFFENAEEFFNKYWDSDKMAWTESVEIIEGKVRDIFEEALENSIKKDFEIRYTTVGPQKDDINIKINEVDARKFASQGQQRTAALSIKLSEIELIKEEKGEYPILLLDDVLSELDISRQNYLLNSIRESQIFITTTNIPEELSGKIKDSKVIEIV